MVDQGLFRSGRHLAPAALIAAVGAVPGPALADWFVEPSVDVEEQYTDNVRAVQRGRESDWITTVSPGVVIRADTARLDLNLNYVLSQDEYLDTRGLSGTRHNLLMGSTFEVDRDSIFLDAAASFERVDTTRAGATTAIARSLDTNQADVFNYRFTPSWRSRVSNWLESDLSYSFSQALYDPLGDTTGTMTTTPSDAVTHRVRSRLSSGPRFTRLLLALTGDYSLTKRDEEGDDEFERRTGELEGEYAYNRYLDLLASVGYEQFDDVSLGPDFDGEPIWTVGFRLTPGPRTTFRFEYGQRFGDDTYSGDFQYIISPTLQINAFYEESLEVQQTSANRAFDDLGVNDAGDFINQPTGLDPVISNPDFDLTNADEAFLERVLTIALSGSRGRNSYGAQLSHIRRSTDLSDRDERVVSGAIDFGRQLTPRASINLVTSYSDTKDSTSSDQDTFRFTASWNYIIGDGFIGGVSYSYLNRDSEADDRDLRENAISVRVGKIF